MPTSGVTVIGKNPMPLPVTGSIPLKLASAEKPGNSGDEKFGWLKRLNTSTLNWSFTCSPSEVVLNSDRSKFA